MLAAAYSDSFKPGAKLEFHAGWSGWTRPPSMVKGVATSDRSAKGGSGGFLGVLNALRLDSLGEFCVLFDIQCATSQQ